MNTLLTPGENVVLTIARGQVERGVDPGIDVTRILIMTLDRLIAADTKPDPERGRFPMHEGGRR